ncbi:MAG: periplasmic heavy metal sensor [Acidobacteriota bacterium]|nr:periplasmic heavy metal sensor [Acidobacteriota bacterium]
MTKKRLTLVVLIAALAAVPLFVYAAGPAMQRMHGHGGPGGHGAPGFAGLGFMAHLRQVSEELDLSAAQKEQIHGILRQAHEQNAQYREQLHGGFQSVAQALIANPNDIAGAQALMARNEAAESAMKANMLTAASKALNVLTPEQRTKLSGIVAEHAAKMQARRDSRK